MVGTTPATCPRRPAGADEHLLCPMLPRHPAGTLALDQRPCRPIGAKAAPQPDAGHTAALATVDLMRASHGQRRPIPFPSGPMQAGNHAARGPRRHSTSCARPGRPATPSHSGVQRGADGAAPRTRRPVRPDTWMHRTPGPWTPGHRTHGRWTSARPVDGHSPRRDRTRRTGQRPAWPASGHPRDRRPPAGQSDLARSRRPGRSTQDGSAVMAPAPRPDRRRHWTAASTARHEAAPRRTALVCWIWMVREESNGTTEGELCGVALVRECGWGCSLGAEVAWWSAYGQ